MLDEAIREALARATGKIIGLTRIPGQSTDAPLNVVNVELPYAILYPLPARSFEASMEDPLDLMEFNYQVTSVGQDAQQAGWMSRRVMEALMGTTPGSQYATRIIGNGFTIAWRALVSLGGLNPSGPSLYTGADDYRFYVGP